MCPLDLEGDGRKSQARAVVVKRRVFIKKEENEKAKLEKQKNELYMWGNVGDADQLDKKKDLEKYEFVILGAVLVRQQDRICICQLATIA